MLIREEVNRDQIEIFRKMDLKNHEEIILSSEFIELDLEEFKLLFNKGIIAFAYVFSSIDTYKKHEK